MSEGAKSLPRLAALLGAVLTLGLAMSAAHANAAEATAKQPVKVEADAAQTCIILGSGKLHCWGENESGQLGLGHTETIGDDELPADSRSVPLGRDRKAVAVAAGAFHTCAILDTGEVKCWGENDFGQLGLGSIETIGDDETPAKVEPVDLGPGRTATAITAGSYFTCVILDTQDAKCWGRNENGQLGQGDTDTHGLPALIPPIDLGGRQAVAIDAMLQHVCARLAGGEALCWGDGSNGQLGQASTDSIGGSDTPAAFPGIDLGAARSANSVSAGYFHSCALMDNRRVRCWGSGLGGNLGYGMTGYVGDDEPPRLFGPVELGAGRTARSIDASGSPCAVLDTRKLRCWGFGEFGSLGQASTEDIGDDEVPADVPPVDLGAKRTVRSVSVSVSHACAILDNRKLRCWGGNRFGQLGYGNTKTIGDDETPGSVGTVKILPRPYR